MRATLPLILASSLFFALGCNVGNGEPFQDSPDAANNGDTIELSGTISEDRVLEGKITMLEETLVDVGVELRIMPGATFEAAQNAVLRVHGSLIMGGYRSGAHRRSTGGKVQGVGAAWSSRTAAAQSSSTRRAAR